MPIIPLKTVGYTEDLNKFKDSYNDNMRQLDWLLNNKKLDSANISPIQYVIQPPPEEEKDVIVDDFGVNTEYIKYYPNKCFNSSFELFDDNMKPDYWDTDGVVSPDSNFDNDHSLKLTPGQYAEQTTDTDGAGMADASWWPWASATRVSFRVKGNSDIKVSDVNGASMWYWKKGADGEQVKVSGTTLTFNGAEDWPIALKTLAIESTSKIKLRFENVGAGDLYIDAVQIEPDWTGKWPSIYSDGPKSATGGVVAGDEYMEYANAPWDSAGVTFDLVNGYTEKPVVNTSVDGVASEFTSPYSLVVEHIQETIDTQTVYSKIKVTPISSDTPTSATISIQAVCKGKVEKVV